MEKTLNQNITITPSGEIVVERPQDKLGNVTTLIDSLPEETETTIKRFYAVYRDGLDTIHPRLIDIIPSQTTAGRYVGVYKYRRTYDDYEYFFWEWDGKMMNEVDQQGVRDGLREVHRAEMKRMNPRLFAKFKIGGFRF